MKLTRSVVSDISWKEIGKIIKERKHNEYFSIGDSISEELKDGSTLQVSVMKLCEDKIIFDGHIMTRKPVTAEEIRELIPDDLMAIANDLMIEVSLRFIYPIQNPQASNETPKNEDLEKERWWLQTQQHYPDIMGVFPGFCI